MGDWDDGSQDDAAAKGRALVEVLSCVLSRLVLANDQKLAGRRRTMTKFHALRPPDISVRDYLQRILKFAACSPECFVLALVYIDRLIRGNRFVLSSLNVHRVIITSVMLAAKFFDDQYFKNKYYAQVGGVPCAEINSLELEFLFSINFSLHVKPEDFAKYEFELRKHVMASVGCTCGRLAPIVDSVFTMSRLMATAPLGGATAAPAAPATATAGTAGARAPPVPAPLHDGSAGPSVGAGGGGGAVAPVPVAAPPVPVGAPAAHVHYAGAGHATATGVGVQPPAPPSSLPGTYQRQANDLMSDDDDDDDDDDLVDDTDDDDMDRDDVAYHHHA